MLSDNLEDKKTRGKFFREISSFIEEKEINEQENSDKKIDSPEFEENAKKVYNDRTKNISKVMGKNFNQNNSQMTIQNNNIFSKLLGRIKNLAKRMLRINPSEIQNKYLDLQKEVQSANEKQELVDDAKAEQIVEEKVQDEKKSNVKVDSSTENKEYNTKKLSEILGEYIRGSRIISEDGRLYKINSEAGKREIELRLVQKYPKFEDWNRAEYSIYKTKFGKQYTSKEYGFFSNETQVALIKSFYENGMNLYSPSEEQLEKFKEQLSIIAEKNPSSQFIKSMQDEKGNLDINLARITSQKFINAHNYIRAQDNITARVNRYNDSKPLELSRVSRRKTSELFADIVIASNSSVPKGNILNLLNKINLNGEAIINKDNLEDFNIDKAVELYNKYTGNQYSLDDPEFQEILNKRQLTQDNYKYRLYKIEKNIELNRKELEIYDSAGSKKSFVSNFFGKISRDEGQKDYRKDLRELIEKGENFKVDQESLRGLSREKVRLTKEQKQKVKHVLQVKIQKGMVQQECNILQTNNSQQTGNQWQVDQDTIDKTNEAGRKFAIEHREISINAQYHSEISVEEAKERE